jgi:uncharacterized protein YndB with AHSA1/START domain
MAKPFEVKAEVECEATPEQVWEAITTGTGWDGWFMGTNHVTPGLGGTISTDVGGGAMESVITTWDEPHHLAVSSPEMPDGRLMIFEFQIEAEDGGTTLLRVVHHGFLPDADWENEFTGLKLGDPAYIFKIGEYLKYFRGRTATPIGAFGPKVDRDEAWTVLKRETGLGEPVTEGTQVHFTPAGLPPIDGVVDYVTPDFLGVRTPDAIYRFIHGFDGTMVLGHHIFAPVDREQTEHAWQSWLTTAFAQAAPA